MTRTPLRAGNMHVRYRSYSTSQGQGSKITVYKLLDGIDMYIRLIYEMHLEEQFQMTSSDDILLIKSLLEKGSYSFTPLQLDVDKELIVRSPYDCIVMGALYTVLVEGLSPYYGENCFSKYEKDINLYDTQGCHHNSYLQFHNRILEWRDMDGLILIESRRSLYRSKLRLIEKLRPIMDTPLLNLIKNLIEISACDKDFFEFNKTFHYTGTVPKKSKYTENSIAYCFPPYERYDQPYQNLRYELFNFLLDDVDQLLVQQLPNVNYARLYEYIFMPYRRVTDSISSEVIYLNLYHSIYNIYDECNLLSPLVERTTREKGLILPKRGFSYVLNKEGSCVIELANYPF